MKNILSHSIERLQIPPFATENSLVEMGQTNINITNICKTILIPGQASLYAVIYAVLNREKGINAWSCGPNTPTIPSLDLVLYEKSHKLINSRENKDLENFILYSCTSAQLEILL